MVLTPIPVNVRLNQNAVITDRIQTGVAMDADRGHNVPVWEDLEIAATLDATQRPPQDLKQPQVENASIRYVTGWSATDLVEAERRTLNATLGGVKGLLTLEPINQDPAVYRFKKSRLTGYPVHGWFQAGGGYE